MKKKYRLTYKNLLDLRNLKCPDPIILLRKKIRKMKHKEIILILSNDFSTQHDIPIFCHLMDHNLIETFTNYFPYKYLLQKK